MSSNTTSLIRKMRREYRRPRRLHSFPRPLDRSERERDSDDVRRRRRGRTPTTPSLLCMTTTKTATAEGQKSKERKGRGRKGGGREGEPTTELSRPLPMDRVGGGGGVVVSRRARTNDFIGGRGMPLRRREGGGTTANNHRRRRRHFRLTGGTKGRARARSPRSIRAPSTHGKGEFVRLSLFHIHVIAISEACRSIDRCINIRYSVDATVQCRRRLQEHVSFLPCRRVDRRRVIRMCEIPCPRETRYAAAATNTAARRTERRRCGGKQPKTIGGTYSINHGAQEILKMRVETHRSKAPSIRKVD